MQRSMSSRLRQAIFENDHRPEMVPTMASYTLVREPEMTMKDPT